MAGPHGADVPTVRLGEMENRSKKRGAANRTRTCDPVITNDVLYQLSYCGEPYGAFGDGAENART